MPSLWVGWGSLCLLPHLTLCRYVPECASLSPTLLNVINIAGPIHNLKIYLPGCFVILGFFFSLCGSKAAYVHLCFIPATVLTSVTTKTDMSPGVMASPQAPDLWLLLDHRGTDSSCYCSLNHWTRDLGNRLREGTTAVCFWPHSGKGKSEPGHHQGV